MTIISLTLLYAICFFVCFYILGLFTYTINLVKTALFSSFILFTVICMLLMAFES